MFSKTRKELSIWENLLFQFSLFQIPIDFLEWSYYGYGFS